MSDFIYNPSDFSPQNGHAGVYGNANAVNHDLYNSNAANWKDSTAFAYQQLAKYEDNALNIALMNYQNEYNSPYQQMQRYQQAGINPFDVVGKQAQPAAGANSASGGSARASKVQEQANGIRLANDMMRNLVSFVHGATDLQGSLQELKYNEQAFPLMVSNLSMKKNLLSAQITSEQQNQARKALDYIFTAYLYGFDPEKLRYDTSDDFYGSRIPYSWLKFAPKEFYEGSWDPSQSLRTKDLDSLIKLRGNQRKLDYDKLEQQDRQFRERYNEMVRHNKQVEEISKRMLALTGVKSLLSLL